MNRPLLSALLLLVVPACGKSGKDSEAPAQPTPTSYAQKLLSSLDRAAIEKSRSDMSAIRTAIVAASTENGKGTEAADFAALCAEIAPAYIRRVPPHDGWGFVYVFENKPEGWRLIAPGADGAAGTGDDIVLGEGGFLKLPDGYHQIL